MTSRILLHRTLFSIFSLSLLAASPALADSSHARIVRLSLVQGDVRFARDFHGDSLADSNVTWEAAEPNLPIRQGYVIGTDNGRAEVEFENGAMAFLAEHSALEFYDLSLEDGAKTTRLVLRQGTASFYVNPAGGDYFSVTGGDFTVEAAGRTSFRVDNFDDGSSLNVLKGNVSLLRKNKTTALTKGQSFSIRAGDDKSVSVGRVSDDDDFDRWVSGRIDSVASATTAAQQYVSSPYYTSGLADLYTYGSWYPVSGYGYCWRPYGVGLGWSPFVGGGWFSDPVYGSAFIGYQPWGWLPYHFGGWIFDPVFGWVWAATGFGNGGFGYGYVPWRPVTGVWVRTKPGLLGIVPAHPLDAHGKAPINLAKGVFPVANGAISERPLVATGEEWKVVKSVPQGTLSTAAVAAAPLARVSRTVASGSFGTRVVTLDRGSSIAYDPVDHRFVNTNSAPATPKSTEEKTSTSQQDTGASAHVGKTGSFTVQGGVPQTAAEASARAHSTSPPTARGTTEHVPSRAMTPPPAPSARGTSIGGGSVFDASRGSSASSTSSHTMSAPVSHTPSAAPSGGRPH